MNIEETVKKINNLIDSKGVTLNATEIMQLSQSALNLAHTAATLDAIKNRR